MKRCIFIIGMHRSGTSATAGMLHAGGLCLGKDLMEPDWINPKGYFEDQKVIDINMKLYHYYKASLWYPPYMEDDEGQFALTFQQFIDYYRDVDVVAFKNPRFCATFPVWLWYFSHENNIDVEILLPKRQSSDIVKSLMRIHNMDQCVAEAIVIRHISLLNRIEAHYSSMIKLVLQYDTVVQYPERSYYLVNKKYDLNLNPNGYKHIDKSLKHF